MNTDTLVRLLDAGFTKDEIMKLTETQPAPEPKQPAPEQKPKQPAPEQKPEQPAPEQETEPKQPAPETGETDKRLTAIENNIAQLVKAVQMNNLKHDSFGSVPDSLETQTDKIMAAIIRPDTERKD